MNKVLSQAIKKAVSEFSPIIKENPEDVQKDINNLNDKEQKSLDQVINRIFAKI